MVKATIYIKMINGESITYVNKITDDAEGSNERFYGYSNEVGDTYDEQTGNGKVKGDLENLKAQVAIGTGFLIFPEDGGTDTLVRRNSNQSISSVAKLRKTLKCSQVSSIEVNETQTNEWTDLEKSRGVVRF